MQDSIQRIYLSGSISNDPDYETKFKAAAEKLRNKGFTVINPVELGHTDKSGANIDGLDESWEYHLMRDLCAMLGYGIINDACQGIAVIPYDQSYGAELERIVAERLGLKIKNVDEWLKQYWTDEEILAVTSPQEHVNGPHLVIKKEAVKSGMNVYVLMDWDGEPCMGTRIFNEDIGEPSSGEVPGWDIQDILERSALTPVMAEIVDDYFSKREDKITASELSELSLLRQALEKVTHSEEILDFYIGIMYKGQKKKRDKVKIQADLENRGKEKRACKEELRSIERGNHKEALEFIHRQFEDDIPLTNGMFAETVWHDDKKEISRIIFEKNYVILDGPYWATRGLKEPAYLSSVDASGVLRLYTVGGEHKELITKTKDILAFLMEPHVFFPG